MSTKLDQLVTRIPKAGEIERDVVARFAHTSPRAAEKEALGGLVQWLWAMCELFFWVRPSRDRTVAGILSNDAFSLAVVCVRRLAYSELDQQACLDVIEDLLLDVATDPDRNANEVEPALVSAFILARALQDTRDGGPARNRVESKVIRRDALYRSLAKDARLTDVLYAVRQRFSPRARIL